jgi:hypothetical protein
MTKHYIKALRKQCDLEPIEVKESYKLELLVLICVLLTSGIFKMILAVL